MTREKLTLFDTTLRDGPQMAGVDFSLADKRHIAALLDGLGIDYIEGGYPGANPLDTEFFAQRPKLKTSRFAAFGMTKRAGRSAANDPGLASLLKADADVIAFVAKAWDYHVHVALGCTLEENLENIRQSIEAALVKGREAILDCEHFFDGFEANRGYALSCAKTACAAGARYVV
ncbi:MAG: citramalate synthase, partial [Methylocella sp.]